MIAPTPEAVFTNPSQECPFDAKVQISFNFPVVVDRPWKLQHGLDVVATPESLEVCQRPVHVGAHRRRLTDPVFGEFGSYFDAKTERQIAGGILFSHRFPITTVEACAEEVHHVN